MKRRAMKSHEKKNCPEKRNFSYIKLLMSICTRENSSPPAQVVFCWGFTLIVARNCRHVGV